MRWIPALALLCGLVLFAPARADFVDIEILPEHPDASRLVGVRFHYIQSCLIISENPDGQSYQVTSSGNEIVLDLVVQYICIDPPPPNVNEYDVPLGVFPEGEYDLTINLVADFTTFPVTPGERELLAEMPIVVGEPVLEPIPVMGRTGQGVLVIGLLLAGLYAFRRQ